MISNVEMHHKSTALTVPSNQPRSDAVGGLNDLSEETPAPYREDLHADVPVVVIMENIVLVRYCAVAGKIDEVGEADSTLYTAELASSPGSGIRKKGRAATETTELGRSFA